MDVIFGGEGKFPSLPSLSETEWTDVAMDGNGAEYDLWILAKRPSSVSTGMLQL